MVIVLYYILPHKAQKPLLLVASLFFYACGSIDAFLLLVVSIFIDFAFSREIIELKKDEKSAKAVFVIGVAYNILILGYYKYADFIVSIFNIELQREEGIILPLGLSFFTFKAISLSVKSSSET